MTQARAGIRHIPIPDSIKPALRFLYEFHFLTVAIFRRLGIIFYKEPIFRGRVANPSQAMVFFNMPDVTGAVDIQMGRGVLLGGGDLRVRGGPGPQRGQLILRDHSSLGANSRVIVHERVLLEEHCIVGINCWISDSDSFGGGPMEQPRPVLIGRYAWVANGVRIYAGVTIGEGAIVSAQSVVINDVPPYCVVMGNPAEVYFRNVGKPKRKLS